MDRTNLVPSRIFWSNRDWFLGLLLILAVILVYQPAWYAGFIWDDDAHLTANPCIIGPLGLKEVWTTSAANYFPLTLTSWWILHALFGLNPLPYHLVNVLTHGACAILLWRVLRSLLVPGAWLGAALWALHPVQVNSVAWVSEFINEQSCLFYLLAVLLYAKAASEPRSRIHYAPAILCAALALLSKPSTVMLPVVLVLCQWWREGRWSWRGMLRMVPFFLISAAAGVWTIWEQKYHSGALGEEWVLSWAQRIVVAGWDVWFYLGKLAWPHPLIFIYPRWDTGALRLVDYFPVVSFAGVILGLWWRRNGVMRPVFFAATYFVVSLFPVLGFFNVYFFRFSYVADHFQYLASMGPLALVGAGMAVLADVVLTGRVWLQRILCTGLLLSLGMLSWQRAWVYQNEETLWTDTLAQNPSCWLAHNNLGNLFLQKGQVDGAMVQFQKALELNPDYAEAHNNLGNALAQEGQVDEAISHYQRAMEINPGYVEAHNDLGGVLLQRGQVDEAMTQLQIAVKIDPNLAEAHNNLGAALLQRGWLNEAAAQFQKAVEINPDYATAHNNLGNALTQMGRAEEAMVQLQKAVEINPDYAEAHYNLGNALVQDGQLNEGITHFQKAIDINPNYSEARNNLGIVLVQVGRVNEAIAQFQEVVRLNPHDNNAQTNLAKAQAIARQTTGSK